MRRLSAALAASLSLTGLAALGAGPVHAAPSGVAAIRITEVAYGGKIVDPNGDGEYVELTNLGTAPQSLAGWTYTGKPGAGTLPLDDLGTVAPGETVLITDVAASVFRHDWSLSGSVKIIDDKANGHSVTLDSGPDTPTIYDATGAAVDSVSYAKGFFPGKGVSAWVDAAHVGARSGTTGWTLSSAGDAEGSRTSLTGEVGSPGVSTLAEAPVVRITEVAYGGKVAGSNGGDGEYVELTNVGTASQDLSGWTYTGKAGAGTLPIDGLGTLAPGESALITDVSPAEFRADWHLADTVPVITDKPAGLSVTLDKGPDTPTIYDAAGAAVDSVSYVSGFFPGKGVSAWPDAAHLGAAAGTTGWTLSAAGDAEASTTSSTGELGSPGTYTSFSPSNGDSTTSGGSSTPPGVSTIPAVPWPGPQTVTTADAIDFGQNLSGLFYVPGTTPAQDSMWGVENGDSGAPLNTGQSSLFKIVPDASGAWGPAAGWGTGVRLHYPDGSGQPDAEGVTGVAGRLFVSTERDNLDNGVSRVAIEEYDPSRVSGGALDASAEWNLEPDFNLPPADANLGFEALAFVPDAYLVGHGFRTDAGALYDPSQYGAHFGGVFFAGLEADGRIYAYVLQADGGFHRLAAFSSGFPTIMDAAWDPSQDALWLDCDNTCDGQTSIARLDAATGHFGVATVYDRPTGGTNVNDEGFTIQPARECDPATDTRAVWWSDDSDDSGHALRTARVACPAPITGQVGATVTTSASGAPNAAGWYDAPVTVSFACSFGDAVLQQACPSPVVVSSSQPATSAGTLTDTLGNVYDAAVPALRIDATAPQVAVSGAADGATYALPPSPTCAASDDLSGVAGCALSTEVVPVADPVGSQHSGTVYRTTATATDVAGNVATSSVTYVVEADPHAHPPVVGKAREDAPDSPVK